MATLGEIEFALKILTENNLEEKNICTTLQYSISYSMEDVNLNTINTIKNSLI